jgi:ribonuclease BN (tRNA processing enzyme)
LSGYALAREADLLIHDAQYSDDEYPAHFGWGHSAVSHVLDFASRCRAKRTVLFHHDPFHTDANLDAMLDQTRRHWSERGQDPASLELAREKTVIEMGATSRA